MPTIISDGGGATASVALAEDRLGVTRVVAIDNNPTTITYSIVSGADQLLFQINATTGLLAFVGVPNFEAPTDTDHDNAYVVQVQATNGAQTTTQTITVNVTDANDISGTAGADFLVGGPTAEVIDGLAGADQLLGNGGHDTFLINRPTDGVDSLLDFWSGDDVIGLDQIGFGIGGNGSLAVNGVKYVVGAAATTASPTIIFNPTTSVIFWDADGTGAGAPVAFARFDPGSTVVWAETIDLGSHGGNYQVVGTGDFDGNGTSDILWRNPTTGQIDEWHMVNGNWGGSIDLGTHGADYQVAGVGDFNHNGTSDILWRSASTGQVDLWLMVGGNWSSSVDLGSHGTSFQVAGVGDFNGDGTSDILWRNPTTGQVDLWLMNNGNWSSSVDLGSHGTDFQVAGIGDFNGDGTSDILWRNSSTGQVDEWKMLNGNWAGSVDLGNHGTAWQVGGVTDLNGNGTSDILWRNPTTAEVDGWVMSNGNWAGSTLYSTAPEAAWVVSGTGDFNGDGVGDVLWRNPTTGQVNEWHLVRRPIPTANDFNFEGNIVPNVSIPVDTDVAANSVVEGDPSGTHAGLTASSTNPSGDPVTYSLSDSAGGRFAIDPNTGVVTIANAALVNFETAPGAGPSYNITVTATSGTLVSSRVFSINVGDVAPNQPSDADGATNTIVEGATTGAVVGVTVSALDINGGPLTYSFFDSDPNPVVTVLQDAGGRFQINSVTGVVSVSAAGAATIDYETSGAGHSYDITVQAFDGALFSPTKLITIAVANANPSTPVDSNGATGGSIQEGSAQGTLVGITAASTDPAGPAIAYSLTDSASDRFQIDSSTGVVSAGPNANTIDFESGAASYNITVQASDGALTNSQTFAVAVTNANPSNWSDGDGNTNTVTEGVGSGAATGVTVHATDPAATALNYTLIDDAGGRFQIANSLTGVVTTGANANLIDFELSGGSYNITAQASDGAGGTSTQVFTIAVADAPPSSWSDTNAGADSVVEGAANLSGIGIHANAIDPNGGVVTYTLTVNPGNAFAIDPSSGVITVADGTAIDFESTAGSVPTHTYTLTVKGADASGSFTTHDFIVDVTNAAPSTPGGTVGPIFEGDAQGTVVVTATSVDPGGSGAVTYSLTNSAGGLFEIDTSGVVTISAAGETGIDYETSGVAHSYGITVDAFDGTVHSTRDYTVVVQNKAPTKPVEADANTANDVVSKSPIANTGDQVGITLSSTDPNNGATITYSLTDDAGVTQDAGGLFSVDAGGVVRVANNAQLSGPSVPASFTIFARAFDGTNFGLAQDFTIGVISNSLTVDLNGSGGAGNAGEDFAATYTEQGAAKPIADTDDVITNTGTPGANTIVSATIVLTDAKAGDSFDLSTLPGGFSPVVTPGAGTITLTLSGAHTFAQYSSALQQIKFTTSGDAPDTSPRHINVTVNDGSTNSNTAQTIITVESTNDTPTLTLGPAGAVSYTENGGPLAFFTSGSVTDVDAPANFNGGSYTVEITANADTGDQIVLLGASGFTVAAGPSLVFGGNTIGTITGLGTSLVTIDFTTAFATPAVVSQLSDAFGFQSSSENPSTTDRTVSFTFNDGSNSPLVPSNPLDSNVVTQTIQVTAVNDAPVNTVPAGALNAIAGVDFVIAGLSVTDVDSAGLSETTKLEVTHGTLSVTLAGATTISAGTNGTGSLTLSGSIADINATLANNVIYHALTGFATDTLTVTTNDAGHSPSGVLVDTDVVNIKIAAATTLDGQLWYVTRDGVAANDDNVVGYINSDNSQPPVHYFTTATDTENDIGVDTAAGLYFVINPVGGTTSGAAVEAHLISDGSLVYSRDVGTGVDEVNALAVDTIHQVIFVGVTCTDADDTGITVLSYFADPSIPATYGQIGNLGFLLTQTTQAAFHNGVDFSIDAPNHLLYYVDTDLTTTNGIYLLDYGTGPTYVGTDPTPTLLTSSVFFAPDGSTNGFIESVAVDNRNTASATDDIIYFLTTGSGGLNLGGSNALWYIDPSVDTDAHLVTGISLLGAGIHAGLTFDAIAHQLYISDQGDTTPTPSVLIQAQLDSSNHNVSGTTSHDLTALTGHAAVSVVAQTAFDVLPTLSAADTPYQVGGSAVLDASLTVTDPEGYLSGVTITTSGGFAGAVEQLDYNLAGTSITGPASPKLADAGGNITLTLTGYDTVAHYQQVLRSLTFSSADVDPTFGGANSTRTVAWHLDDGAPTALAGINNSTTTINIAVQAAPALDLDSTSAVGVGGNDYAANFNIGGAAVAIASTNVDIVDPDDTNMESATVVLTTGDASDTLTINGALPAGISGSVGPLVGGPVGGTITVSLSGSASKSAYDQALHQILFSTADASASPAARSIDFVVNDGTVGSNHPTSTITIIANPAPQAADDTDAATEAGGANNGTAGVNPSGNVITGVGTDLNAAGADTDPAPGSSAMTVVAVAKGSEAAPGAAGTVGSALTGLYGTLTLNSGGSYTYVVDNTNATVQALRISGDTLTDLFNYRIQDAFGASDTTADSVGHNNSIATLTITITGANDNPTAVADTASATEKGGVPGNGGTGGVDPTGNVLTNDTDVDANGETKTVQGVAFGVQAGPLTLNTGADVNGSFGKINIAAGGGYTYTVDNTNASVQALRTFAQTLTETFSYTMHDAANTVPSTTQIVVTIHGQNDNPVANNDAANAQEQGGTLNGSGGFNPSGNVLTALGGSHSTAVADTDVDTAANGETQTVQGVAATDVHLGPALITGVGAAVAGTYGSLTINSNGSFSYTLNNSASNVQALTAADHPTDVFTYTMKDTVGVTANAIVTVTVDGANDAPVSVNDGTYVVIENRATSVTTPTLLANDTDVDAGASLTAVKDTDTLHGGVVTVNANGTFSVSYVVANNNYLGTDTFTYHANDGSLNSASATVTLDVQPLVWFIDSSIGASDATHFKTIAEFNTANGGATHADIVYLMYGNPVGTGVYATADGINLSSGQVLLGQGVDLTYTKTDTTLVTLLNTDNTKIPTIQVTGGAGNAGVTLSTNNTLKGFTIDSTNADAIGIEDGGGTVGTLTISNGVTIGGVGKAIDIDQGGTLAVSLNSIASTGSNSEGIQLGGVAGTLLGGSFAVTGTTSITNADTTGIQVLNTAASTTFNFGTSTSVTDSVIGGGSHNGNGIELATGIGATNGFTFGNLGVTTDGGFGLKAVSAGTVTFGATNSINATGGAAVDITSTALANATFGTVSSSGSSTYGINLVNQTSGTFTASAGTIGTADTAGVHISGGTAAASIASAINSSNGNAVDISGHSGGQIDLSGTINHTSGGDKGIIVNANTGGTINFTGQTTIASTTATGVDLTTNGGTTINFNAGGNGLDITTTTGVGFNATGGATAINVQGTGNTINSTNGTALNIANTTIGASNVTFQSISSGNNDAGADPVSGIILNNTGTSGHLTVTGDGTAANNGSGGTIQRTTGDGISLTSTQDVNLSQMNITSNLGDGIGGSTVNGLVLNRLNISGNGNDAATDESGINISQLTGSASNGAHATSISNSVISNNHEFELQITNSSGTLTNFQLIGNAISSNGLPINGAASSPHGNLVNFLGHGTAIMGLTVTGGTFTGNWNAASPPATITGTGVHADTDASAGGIELTVNVTGATFTNNNAGVNVSSGNANTDIVFDIENSIFTGQRSTAINIFGNGNSPFVRTMNGTIQGNTIGTNGVVGSGSLVGAGIDIGNESAANMNLLINNNILQSFGSGPGLGVTAIVVNLGLGGQATGGGTTNVTITNNTIRDVLNGRAITIQDNQDPAFGPFPTIFANVAGNTFLGTIAGQAGNGTFMRIRELSGTVKVKQDSPTAANIATELDNANNSTDPTKFTISGAVAFTQGTPPLPSTNPLPQLAAPGGVQSASATQGEMHLTQAQLDGMVAAAMTYWAATGASAVQLAALHNVTYDVADIIPGWLGASTPGHVTIDVDASGYGWFVDPTPFDSAEFGHALSATHLQTDPTQAAAGHMDLLTTVMHEMGEQLGLQDRFAPADRDNLMSAYLAAGERLLPEAADVEAVAQVQQTVGNGQAVSGTAGADTFVFDQSVLTSASAPVHVAGYSAAQGDSFDFSALQVADAAKVRVVEDASDAFATLQIDIGAGGVVRGAAPAPHWVSVAQVDGIHAGDAIDVWLNPAQVAHLHAGLLG